MSIHQQTATDPVWGVERNGINAITGEERHGKPFELFWIWFAANNGILVLVYGGILFAAGLNLWQSVLVALVGGAGSYALVGVLSIAGVRGGAPMLTLSRAAFGPRGNAGPTVVSWLNLVGWEAVAVITAAYGLLGLFSLANLPSNTFWTVVSIAIIAALTVTFGVFGHATLVWIQRAATLCFGLLTIGVIMFLLAATNWSLVLSQPAGPWGGGVLACLSIVIAATGVGWINAGADYTRYLPRRSRAASIIWWTTLGATTPVFVLILVGFLLSSRVTGLAQASNPIQVIGAALPSWMVVPYLLTAVGGNIAGASLSLYSSGLNLLAIGIRAQRYKTVLLDGALIVLGAVYVMLVATTFLSPFVSFLQLLAVGLTAWAAVFLVDMLSRRIYDPAGLADIGPGSCYFYWNGVNLAALSAWLIGVMVGLLFTVSPLVTGPWAVGIFATTSFGYLFSFLVSGILYAGLSRPSLKKPTSLAREEMAGQEEAKAHQGEG